MTEYDYVMSIIRFFMPGAVNQDMVVPESKELYDQDTKIRIPIVQWPP